MNSEFSFSKTGCHIKAQEHCLLCYFNHCWEENTWIHPFPRGICVMWKGKQLRPRFELGLLCSFLTMISITSQAPTSYVYIYSSSTKLKLPTLSLVEKFKLGKSWLFQMLCDSRDSLVKNAQPSIITGRKWKAKILAEN